MSASLAIAAPGPIALASDYDCADFANQAEAEEYLLPGDPYNLDADSDEIACEDLPCPCSYNPGSGGGGSIPPAAPAPPPPPPKLRKSVARDAAIAKAHRYSRHHGSDGTLRLERCGRRSKYRVDCSFAGRARSPDRLVTCHGTVVVRGEGDVVSSARLHIRCRSDPILSPRRAREAMATEAASIAGKPVAIEGLERRSRVRFAALAFWTQAGREQEECTAELLAYMYPDGRISVSHRAVNCEPVLPQPARHLLAG